MTQNTQQQQTCTIDGYTIPKVVYCTRKRDTVTGQYTFGGRKPYFVEIFTSLKPLHSLFPFISIWTLP